MKTHIRRRILESERRSERASAMVRLLVFLVVSGVIFGVPHHGSIHPGLPILAGYAILAVVHLLATRRGRSDIWFTWLAWTLATCDVLLLLTLFVMISGAGLVAFNKTLGLPIAGLVYLFLAQAAIRYHPALLAYTAGLFCGGWLLILAGQAWLISGSAGLIMDDAMHGAAIRGVSVQLAMIALTAAVLAYVVMRKHQLRLANIVANRMRANLALFLPPNLVASLSYEGAAALERPHRLKAAVLFTDICGFTAMSERADPEVVAAFLNEFRTRCTRVIFARGGTLDKFVGDSAMAVFGAPPTGGNDSRSAILAAFDLLAEMEEWNRQRAAAGREPVAIGIGIHYGTVMAGVIGHPQRLEYTVIGDTVNAAERIEGLTRTNGVSLLVSRDAVDAAGPLPTIAWVDLPPQPVRGRLQPVRVCRPQTISAAPAAKAVGGGDRPIGVSSAGS